MEAREQLNRNKRSNYNKWCEKIKYVQLENLEDKPNSDYLLPMVMLSLHTGMRRGELFSMQWANVNLQKSIITISGHNAKSGKTRHIQLNSLASTIIKKWRSQTTSTTYVFANANGERFDNVKKSWKALLKSANIENFRWHDMRHHFSSKLVMAGVDLSTVRELLATLIST